MKKLTSKSASEAPKTSLPYGTSAPTAVTAKDKKPTTKKVSPVIARLGIAGTLQVVGENARTMTPVEFRASLRKAGIIGTNGKLTANYAKGEEK